MNQYTMFAAGQQHAAAIGSDWLQLLLRHHESTGGDVNTAHKYTAGIQEAALVALLKDTCQQFTSQKPTMTQHAGRYHEASSMHMFPSLWVRPSDHNPSSRQAVGCMLLHQSAHTCSYIACRTILPHCHLSIMHRKFLPLHRSNNQTWKPTYMLAMLQLPLRG
jgi:hypothetical protein